MKKQCKIRGGEAPPDAFGTYHNQNELITTRTNLSQLERPPRRHLSQLRSQFLLTAVIKPNEGSHRCQDGTHAIWAHVSKWCWLWYVRSCCNVRYCYVSVRSRGTFFLTPKQNPVKAPCSRKKYYVNFFLLHICMYKSSGTKSKALGECQNEINFEWTSSQNNADFGLGLWLPWFS